MRYSTTISIDLPTWPAPRKFDVVAEISDPDHSVGIYTTGVEDILSCRDNPTQQKMDDSFVNDNLEQIINAVLDNLSREGF